MYKQVLAHLLGGTNRPSWDWGPDLDELVNDGVLEDMLDDLEKTVAQTHTFHRY